MSSHRCWLVLGMLLLVASRAGAASTDAWWIGAGAEWPRSGITPQSEVSRRVGPSAEAGYDHALRGTSGLVMRMTATRFPAQLVNYSDTGILSTSSTTHTLVTVSGGPRFQRRDLAFSPYFEFGIGLGMMMGPTPSATGGYRSSNVNTGVDWMWAWGGGLAWRCNDRVRVFAGGHFDTVPQRFELHMWAASLRAGLEVLR